jgi:hypothetical protein
MNEIVARVSKSTSIDNLIILDKELVLEPSDSVNIVFGPLGSCYITYHDIIITPLGEGPESFVTIRINLGDYRSEFTTNTPIKITQNVCEPYPSFELKINSVLMHKKKYFYEGVISVHGGLCKIDKNDQLIVDH